MMDELPETSPGRPFHQTAQDCLSSVEMQSGSTCRIRSQVRLSGHPALSMPPSQSGSCTSSKSAGRSGCR